MAATIRTAVSIQKALFDQVEILAQQLKISRSHLIGLAIENFTKNCQNPVWLDEFIMAHEDESDPAERATAPFQNAKTATRMGGRRMMINQGDIYWIPLEEPNGAEPGPTHPHVVIQDNVFNHSRITTVVVCALTSNMKRAKAPGNVLLDAGEANLAKQSVVVVSKPSTVDKTQLGEYIGSVTEQRINQIMAGMQFLQSMTAHREL